MISNNFKEAEEILLQKYKVPRFYQIFISSSDMGVLKPDSKIYQYALKKTDIKPEEAIFIDDSLDNINSAKSIGMHAIQYLDNNQLFREIKEIISQ